MQVTDDYSGLRGKKIKREIFVTGGGVLKKKEGREATAPNST